jgi:hypothetical protein
MPRSKNRVLDIETPCGSYIKVQLQLETGEVVIGSYELVLWYDPPAEIRRHYPSFFWSAGRGLWKHDPNANK